VERVGHLSRKRIKEIFLSATGTEDGFSLIGTPLVPKDRTFFKVYDRGKDIIVAAACFDTVAPFILQGREEQEDIEVFFDPLHNHLGFFQFQFRSDGQVHMGTHLAYNGAHSTAFPSIRLKSFEWEKEYLTIDRDMVHWFFAIFYKGPFFLNPGICGFNLCRYRSSIKEASSWNHCGGPGFCDATSFGHLYYATAPVEVNIEEFTVNGDKLSLTARITGQTDELSLLVVNPEGEEIIVLMKPEHGMYKLNVPFEKSLYGRYRFYFRVKSGFVEPDFFFFDHTPHEKNERFSLCLTYDIPDNLIVNHYTPRRMADEMGLIAGLGINRIYWIDYGDNSAYWKRNPLWGKNSVRTFKECGDMLKCAVKTAHKMGLEFYGIFKVFDMGSNRRGFSKKTKGLVFDENDGKYLSVMPELAEHQEWTMQANPLWQKEPVFPVRAISFYSEQPIVSVQSQDIKLWVSNDNCQYEPYQGKFCLKQEVKNLPNYRWSPAGKIPEKGKRKNYVLNLTDLQIKHPFVAIEIKNKGFSLENYLYLMVDCLDGSGEVVSVILTTSGGLSSGFAFGKTGYSWANSSEGVLNKVIVGRGMFGLSFKSPKNLPTMFEPSFEGTREIWLSRIKRILKSGADGVDIRILCHHNDCSQWLTYAFAEPIRDEFKKRYSRQVEMEEEDYEKIRMIRGEFFTKFLRQTKKMVAGYGKKISLHLEAGIEVLPEYDTKMQIHWNWQTWLNEGLMDEIHLKYWSSQSVWVHENILPLARKKNIPVYLEDQAIDPRVDIRGVEMAENIIKEVCNAGFDGYIFYETWTYIMLNRQGVPTFRGNAEGIIKTACKQKKEENV
jgi:hypothetical protein